MGEMVFNHYPVNIFVLKKLSTYYVCHIYLSTLQATFFMEANIMNHDRTAPILKGAV